MNGNGTDKERNISRQQIVRNLGLCNKESKAGMGQLRQHYNSYEINELYRLAKELNTMEQQILEEAGFFKAEFKAGLMELRQYYSLDEIIDLYRLAGEVKAAGGDPEMVLAKNLNL